MSLVVGSGTLLQACAQNLKQAELKSLTGVCKTFPRPDYQIRGQTGYDQQWADETIESGVAACHWKRPNKRPATLDKPAPKPKKVDKKAPPVVVPVPQPLPEFKPQNNERHGIHRYWDKVKGWLTW